VYGSFAVGAIGVLIALLGLPGRNALAQHGTGAAGVPAQARTEATVPVAD